MCQLFETKKGAVSIPALIERTLDSQPKLSQELRSIVDEHRPLLAKAFSVRCNVYAHRNASLSPQTIFAKAGLTPSEMEAIVRAAAQIVASLAEIAGVDEKHEIVDEIQRRSAYARGKIRIW